MLEILPPTEFEIFVKPFAKVGHQFLVHPLGIAYLEIAEGQVGRLRRQVAAEIALSAQATREAFKRNPTFFAAPSPKDDGSFFTQEELDSSWRAQFRTLAQLNHEQLVRYLRLRYELLPSKTVGDWLDGLSQPKRRELGRQILEAEFGALN